MIRCPKCDNETRTSALVSEHGQVMLAGTIGTDPQPILAQVCSACGYIELYAPQSYAQPEASVETQSALADPSFATGTVPAA